MYSIFKNGVKNGVHTLLFFDKNGVPQLSIFDVKSENGVKIGVSILLFFDKNEYHNFHFLMLNQKTE